MSVAEIKEAIDKLTPAEQEEVSLHLRARRWADTPERRAELTAIADEMGRGVGYSLAELKRQHESRVAEE